MAMAAAMQTAMKVAAGPSVMACSSTASSGPRQCPSAAIAGCSSREATGRTLVRSHKGSRKAQKKNRSGVVVRAMADATEATVDAKQGGGNWVPVLPLEALPKGERRLVRQNGELILLLWYRNEIYAIESRSPAEGAYSEGFANARLTPEGCIVCPSTDTTFDLKTGAIKDWYPNNPVLKVLTRPTRDLIVYPAKVEGDNICIGAAALSGAPETEILYGQTGDITAKDRITDVNIEEVKMQVDESETGFGFNSRNEIINGRAAQIGFVGMLVQELITGKGVLSGLGIMDVLHKVTGQ